jgi:hypothetical protein
MTTPNNQESHQSGPVEYDGVIYPSADFFPSDDVELNWLLAENIRMIVRRVLDQERAGRLLVELEHLFDKHGIYKPASWPN